MIGLSGIGLGGVGLLGAADAGGDATAPSATLTGAGAISAGGASGTSSSITVTPLAHRCWPLNEATGNRTLVFTGTYGGSAPATLEYQLVEHTGGAVVQAWQPMASFSAGAGAWTGTLSFPANTAASTGFDIQVRDGAVNTQDSTGYVIGVAFTCGGQSLMFQLNLDDPSTVIAAPANGWIHTGETMSVSGSWAQIGSNRALAKLANDFAAAFNKHLLLFWYPVGTTSIVDWLWLTGQPYYRIGQKAANAFGGCSGYLINHGEEDAQNQGMGQTQYGGYLYNANSTNPDNWLGNIRSGASAITNLSGQAQMPILLAELGRYGGGPSATLDNQFNGVRAAQHAAAAALPNVYVVNTAIDLDISDYVHITPAHRLKQADRWLNGIKYVRGQSSYYARPTVTSITQVDSTHVRLNIAHAGGTDINAVTTPRGFEALDAGGTATEITAGVRVSATAYDLTVPAGTTQIRYLQGRLAGKVFYITGMNAVTDNSSVGLPLRGFAAMSISTGVVASGSVLTGSGSISAGTASGEGNATAPGASLSGTGSVSSGGASGTSSPNVSGATLTGASMLNVGAASGSGSAVAPGSSITGSGSITGGTASGSNGSSGTAQGQVLTGAGNITVGGASGPLFSLPSGGFHSLRPSGVRRRSGGSGVYSRRR